MGGYFPRRGPGGRDGSRLGEVSALALDGEDVLCDFSLILLGQLQELAAVLEFAAVLFDDADHLTEHGRLRPAVQQLAGRLPYVRPLNMVAGGCKNWTKQGFRIPRRAGGRI